MPWPYPHYSICNFDIFFFQTTVSIKGRMLSFMICLFIRTPNAAQCYFGQSNVQQSQAQRGGAGVAGREGGRTRIHRFFPGAHLGVTETGKKGQEQWFRGGNISEDWPTSLVPQYHPGPRCQESYCREADTNRHLPVSHHTCQPPHDWIPFSSKDSRCEKYRECIRKVKLDSGLLEKQRKGLWARNVLGFLKFAYNFKLN